MVVCVATPAAAKTASLRDLDRKIAHINATYTRVSHSMWGVAADNEISARLMSTQREWEAYRDLRCYALLDVPGADQGAACRFTQTRLRLAELSDEMEPLFRPQMDEIAWVCQEGAAIDQAQCLIGYNDKRDAHVAHFIAAYRRTHDKTAAGALEALYTYWRRYAQDTCHRNYYTDAPVHPPSGDMQAEHCRLMLSLADFPFIKGWK